MRCYSFETLVSYVDGSLDISAVPAVDSHLTSGCAACGEGVEWLRKTLHAMRTDDLQAPPRETVDNVLEYFRKVHRKSFLASVRRCVDAMLLFDSSRQPEYSGVRSVQGSGKQLLYQADHYDIDLRLHPAEPSEYTHIIGQIMVEDDRFDQVSGIPVHVSAARTLLWSTLTDTLGVFYLRSVPQGRYDLKVVLLDREIDIHDVVIDKAV